MNSTFTTSVKWWTLLWQFVFVLLYPLSFVYFFIIGIHVKQKKWIIAGFVYMLLLLSPLIDTDSFVPMSVFSYFFCIAHAVVSRKEYLRYVEKQRLEENRLTVVDVAAETRRDKFSSEYLATDLFKNDAIKAIQDMNAAIPDELLSIYLDKIEGLLVDIFNYLERHPEERQKISDLEKYYMPETSKLLEKYREFNSFTIDSANIQKAKKEIEDILPSIVDAFQKLYNDLMNNLTFEISTDVQVLKDVLIQNGLLKSSSELQLLRKENERDDRKE